MPSTWGTILVIGGAGRLGYFVIQELVKQPECDRIVSINRHIHKESQHDGAEYRAIDVRAAGTLHTLMYEIRPAAIINTAAPAHAVLIGLARLVGTNVYISTSSANVAGGWEHVNVNEKAPYWPEDSKTVSLRLPLITGERDYAFIPGLLDMVDQGQTGVQIGSNTRRLATVSAEDAAVAHVLVLRKLQEPENHVHGEIIYNTNSRVLSFWMMAQIVWAAAGWKKEKEPFIIPESLAMAMGWLAEWAVYLTSFGKRSAVFNQRVVYFMCRTFTYDGSKAERLFGFKPKNDVEDQLRKSVEWELGRRKK